MAEAQLHPDPDATVQRELGHLFAEVSSLYHGRLASVYLARDVESKATVALKTILRLRFLEQGIAARFRRHAAAAALLHHTHIVSTRRHGVSPSFLWYSMDYCPGGSLSTVQPMAVNECIRAVQHIASALDYAHRSGTVHADLRPSNVLLDDRGWVRVSDFGILRALGGVAALETVQCPPGALDYIAPEQLVQDGVAGPAADQYALGVLAYEYLAGFPLFGASSTEDLMARRRAGPPPDITDLRNDVPSRLAIAMRRALSDAPDDRFASIVEFAAAVAGPAVTVVLWPQDATSDSDDTSDDEDAPEDDTAVRPVARGRHWWILGVASALFLAAAGGLWFALSTPSRSLAESAVVSPAPVTPPPEPPSLDVERAPPPAADPPPAPPPLRPAQLAPPLRPAQLVVSSVPWAEVYVDGRLVGNTPIMDLRLPAGQHRLRLQRVGFRPYEQVVHLAPGQTLRITGIVLPQETAP